MAAEGNVAISHSEFTDDEFMALLTKYPVVRTRDDRVSRHPETASGRDKGHEQGASSSKKRRRYTQVTSCSSPNSGGVERKDNPIDNGTIHPAIARASTLPVTGCRLY